MEAFLGIEDRHPEEKQNIGMILKRIDRLFHMPDVRIFEDGQAEKDQKED
jgi:hypothetical protein